MSRFVPALLLAASLAWCIYWFMHARGYWEDDAWIHLEFARSVANGQGFAFDGRVVAGDTAPLWVLLLAGMHILVPQWLAAGKLLTVLGAAFGVAGIYAFARRIGRKLLPLDRAGVFPAAMVLLVAVNPYTCYWIFSGMEPVAAAGLGCWAVLAATRERPTAISFLTACLLAGLGPLLRPEMTALAVLLALPLIGQWRRLRDQPAAKFLCAAVGLTLLAGPLLAWWLYSWHAFGHLLPNTSAAKRATPNESVLLRLIAIYIAGLPIVLCGAVAACLHLALHFSAAMRSLRCAVASQFRAPGAAADRVGSDKPRPLPLEGWLFILLALIATAYYLHNHTYVQTRYIFITAPGLCVIILGLALAKWPRGGQYLYIAAAAVATTVSVIIVVPFLRNKAANCDAVQQITQFLHERLPPGAPVAVYSIGQIGFESGHPIIDTGGITRPGAIPYLHGPQEALTHWAESEGAQYYIAAYPPDDRSVPVFTTQTPFIGWTFHTSQYATSIPVEVWKLPQPGVPAHR